ADQLATPLSHEAMQAVGSGLGAAGFVIYDDTVCMVEVARTLSWFLFIESCGQCPQCKFGTGEITAALERIVTGGGSCSRPMWRSCAPPSWPTPSSRRPRR
ncbi:MAG: NADH-ubiquinone oxidoreductase-F iron-sulfur binding region domain-containing protein, partial [Acidimicrobiales bacterium]